MSSKQDFKAILKYPKDEKQKCLIISTPPISKKNLAPQYRS
jgi:hypothetical protein